MKTPPLRVWRVPLDVAGAWFSPHPWRWKCRICAPASNPWHGNSSPTQPAALDAALGHLEVYHPQPAQPRRMEP